MNRTLRLLLSAGLAAAVLALPAEPRLLAQSPRPAPETPGPTTAVHNRAPRRLAVRNVTIIYGSGRPPAGPADLVVENGLISYIGPTGSWSGVRSAEATIDGTGKYVMPGIVNTHMHWHEDRDPHIPQPVQYERNLYLAAGVTTVRDVGGDFDASKRWQAEAATPAAVSPRILVYPVVSKGNSGRPDEIREWIRQAAAIPGWL